MRNQESIEAFEVSRPRHNKDRIAIRNFLELRAEDGATCDRIETELALSHQTASARCSELLRDRIAVRKKSPDGRSIVRMPTRTGAKAAVLILSKYAPKTEFDLDGQSAFGF